jgi:hypothetical protein
LQKSLCLQHLLLAFNALHMAVLEHSPCSGLVLVGFQWMGKGQ